MREWNTEQLGECGANLFHPHSGRGAISVIGRITSPVYIIIIRRMTAICKREFIGAK